MVWDTIGFFTYYKVLFFQSSFCLSLISLNNKSILFRVNCIDIRTTKSMTQATNLKLIISIFPPSTTYLSRPLAHQLGQQIPSRPRLQLIFLPYSHLHVLIGLVGILSHHSSRILYTLALPLLHLISYC